MVRRHVQFTLPGTRLFTPPPGLTVNGKRIPCPVVIPEGKCVYWWVGCTGRRYGLSDTMCRTHFYELRGWTPGRGKACPEKGCDRLANKGGGPCHRCYSRLIGKKNPEHRRAIEAKHRKLNAEAVRKRKKKWNDDNPERCEGYRRRYRERKEREREAGT
jgi:hypothetical protein